MEGRTVGSARPGFNSISFPESPRSRGLEQPELLLAKRGSAPIFAPLFMDILIGILTTVEVIVCLLLILVVLMQRPRQEGLGASFGDAAASQVWGAQTTNVLQKFTVYLAIVLFALTLILAVLISRKQTGSKSEKIFGDAKPAPAAPAAPAAADPHAGLPVKAAEAPKADDKKAAEPAKAPAATPKADDKKAEPAKAPAPAKSEPAKAPETPKAAAPAPAATPASAPAPAAQPK